MLAKCINDEESNWSQQLPYVMMAYSTSVHESTGYTPHFLVYEQEVCLPTDFMYPNPSDQPPAGSHEFVSARQVRFQKAYDSARTALNFNQRRRNAIYNRKVHGPTYQVNEKVLLHNPVVPVGKSPKFSSPWNGPYVILQALMMWPTAFKNSQLKKNSSFTLTDWSYSMNPHRPRMYQRAIKETRKTYLPEKLSNKKHQFRSLTTINALGIIRTIPFLQQPPVLGALLAEHRLLRPHQHLC